MGTPQPSESVLAHLARPVGVKEGLKRLGQARKETNLAPEMKRTGRCAEQKKNRPRKVGFTIDSPLPK
jgi:hypothetical protein